MTLFKVGRVLAVLMLASMSAALADDDLTGQASIIDGDTLGIHGTRIRLWGVDVRRKAASFIAVRTACNIGAVRRPQTIWTRSSRDER